MTDERSPRDLEGAIGAGLEINIIQGYEFVAKHYEADDDVYVLGFSRGAYTARSLVGMVRNCGLIYPKHLPLRVAMAYGIYRTRGDNVDSFTAKLQHVSNRVVQVSGFLFKGELLNFLFNKFLEK